MLGIYVYFTLIEYWINEHAINAEIICNKTFIPMIQFFILKTMINCFLKSLCAHDLQRE